MRTRYSQGDVASMWTDVGSPPMEHDAREPKVGGRGIYAMQFTPSGFCILYTLDGFTVRTCRDESQMGNAVFVSKGEVLPTYVHEDCNRGPCSSDVSRHHYIMVTGPCGVLGCFAMKSGSSLWRGKRKTRRTGDESAPEGTGEENFKWWFDFIVELLQADDFRHLCGPGETIDPQKIRDWLACRT